MQASRPRRLHTPVAIKKPALPIGTSITRTQTHSGTANPRGIQGRTNLSDRSDRSDWSDRSDRSDRSDTSAPPRRPHTTVAIKKPALPNGTSITRAQPHCGTANPRGILWRPHLVHLVHLVHPVHKQAPHPRRPHTTVAIKQVSPGLKNSSFGAIFSLTRKFQERDFIKWQE